MRSNVYYVTLYFILFLLLIVLTRCIYLILTLKNRGFLAHSKKSKFKTIIVIGSGGHTTEILRIVKHLNPHQFSPRIYVVADSDDKSRNKIIETEKCFIDKGEYHMVRIPRSRKVHQSYISSVFTTIYATLYSLPVVLLQRADLILCNGPGTCVPICMVAFLARVLYISNNVIVFFESICRVKTLSLTGKILQYFADQIIVQWPELRESCKRATFIGDIEF